jgi:hypothetical protein
MGRGAVQPGKQRVRGAPCLTAAELTTRAAVDAYGAFGASHAPYAAPCASQAPDTTRLVMRRRA